MRRLVTFFFIIILAVSLFRLEPAAGGNAPQKHYSYLPQVFKSPEVDLSIAAIEFTQVVQTATNSVPLVEGKPTLVRFYISATPAGVSGSVTLSLAASRGGIALPGSPLVIGPKPIPTNPSRADLTTTFNVSLPASWLAGTVTLLATIDSGNVVPEYNESNNSLTAQLVFNTVPPLNVTIVPVNYTHAPTGQYFPGPSTDIVGDLLLRIYPISRVNISFHMPVGFVGDLSAGPEWNRLLDFITDIKNSDGAPASQIYYGYFYSTNEAGASFKPIYAGMGWIGLRAAVGGGRRNSVTADLAPHEFGHNLGRYHAPCGSAPNPDPSYPYVGGISGQYGYESASQSIILPNIPDVMGYCTPDWVSDYTYNGLFADQRARGSAPAAMPVDSLLVNIAFDANGAASFSPVYAITGSPTGLAEGEADYTLELLEAGGTVAASYPLSLLESGNDGPDGPYQAIHAVVPRPAQPFETIRLVREGVVLAEKTLIQSFRQSADLAAGVEQSLAGGTLRWDAPDVPALVRYSADNGLTWTTLGMDVLGGALDIASLNLPGGGGLFEITLADSFSQKIVFASAK